MLTKEFNTSQRVQPIFLEPMQVVRCANCQTMGNWTYEAKLDGYRCLVAKRNNGGGALVAAREWFHAALSADRPIL